MEMVSSVPRWLDRNHFLLRRLHSLSGIVPIGAFLCVHLLTNSTAFVGADSFNEHVLQIHHLPWLLAVEWLFIFLPLAFHGSYGVVIAWQGKMNPLQYPYLDNWRYALQRVTAWITIGFIIIHLLHFRFAHLLGGVDYKEGAMASGAFAFTRQGFLTVWLPVWLLVVIYVTGLTAAVFHFCNGIVTFCITWGITVGVAARKRVSVLAGALGVVLLFWGLASLYALAGRG